MLEGAHVTLEQILDQLRIQNRLTVMQFLRKPGVTQADIIGSLASTGASNREIARLMATSVGTVKVALARQRRKRRSKEDHDGSGEED